MASPIRRGDRGALVVGLGATKAADPQESVTLLARVLDDAGLDPAAVSLVATIEARVTDRVVTGLGLPVVAYPARRLAAVAVPHPSAFVAGARGTPSVAEAAALLGAGPGSELVVGKTTGRGVTIAVARRAVAALSAD